MFDDSKSINLILTKSTGPVIAHKQCRPLWGNVGVSRTRRRLATATMSDRCLPGLVAAWPLRTLPTAAKGDRCNWSRRLPNARAGTYRLINRHCQRVLQVPAGDHEGWHGDVTAKSLPYCKLLASLPRWAAGNGGGGGDSPPPTNKHTNPCTFSVRCRKTLESFPPVASSAESYKPGKHFLSVLIRLFVFPLTSNWRPALQACVFACTLVCLFAYG